MFEKIFTEAVDPDLALRDIAVDNTDPNVKALANIAIGIGIDDAYYSVKELNQALQLLSQNTHLGRAPLAEILSCDCSDFQRAVFFILSGKGLDNMLKVVAEFEHILKIRGLNARYLEDNGVEVNRPVSPYETEFAFGPVCDPDFTIE